MLLATMAIATIVVPASANDDVTRLVEELSSRRRATRVQAERTLIARGPDIVQPLTKLQEKAELDPGVRSAIARIIQAVHRRATESVRRGSLVNLSGRHRLSDVVAEIHRQTGNTIHLPTDELGGTLVELSADKKLYWTIAEELARQTQRGLAYDESVERWALVDSNKDRVTQVVGPFRVVLDRVSLRDDLTDDSKRIMRTHVQIGWESKTQPLFVQFDAADWQLQWGVRMAAPFSPDGRWEQPTHGGFIRIPMNFSIPRDFDTSAITVVGRARVTVAATQARFEFPLADSATAKTKRHASVAVTLREVRRGRQIRVRLGVSYDRGGPTFASHRRGAVARQAFLASKDNQKVAATRTEVAVEADGGFVTEYTFDRPDDWDDDALDQVQFVAGVPVQIVELNVPFELAAPAADRRK